MTSARMLQAFRWTALLSGMTLLIGCSSSSPRFRAPESGSRRIIQEDDEFRFASKVRREETSEDDRKVDQQSAKRKLMSRPTPSGKYSNVTPKGVNRDNFLLNLVSYLGAPYLYGGTTKDGMDCSGFTSVVYTNALNTNLPRSTRDQYQIGNDVEKKDLQFGDLVFFNTTGYNPSHVGIYIEDDLFAHASVSYGVTISSLESTYYKDRFVGAKRVVRSSEAATDSTN
jgi:cell wall-associated NlpC family hydrolase